MLGSLLLDKLLQWLEECGPANGEMAIQKMGTEASKLRIAGQQSEI